MDYQPNETRRSQPLMGEVLPARSMNQSVRARSVILRGPGAPQAAAGGANMVVAANVIGVAVGALMVLLYVFGFGMAIVVACIVGMVKASNKRR